MTNYVLNLVTAVLTSIHCKFLYFFLYHKETGHLSGIPAGETFFEPTRPAENILVQIC